jgi:hypothetical protein
MSPTGRMTTSRVQSMASVLSGIERVGVKAYRPPRLLALANPPGAARCRDREHDECHGSTGQDGRRETIAGRS